jgi:SAM-dependent methyltransferase
MSLKQAFVAVVPKFLRPKLRALYWSATDRIEVLLGRRDPLTPPKRMWHLVTSPDLDFKEEGEGLRRFLKEKIGLQPHETVLDVGCGIGRNAVPLIGHLSEYHGFDIMPDAVKWCQKNIARRHPNFHFHFADIYNKSYNPEGKYEASEYRFPYPDETFDLVFLVSVFTHMLYRDVENYLSEIARVLKPGGRCAISFLLLNDEARKNMATGLGAFDFKYELDNCYAQYEAIPEAAIAYDEERIRDLYMKHHLAIKEPILYGTWSTTKVMMQDIVIAFKPE